MAEGHFETLEGRTLWHTGFTIWLTGLSGAGKSTLASAIEQRLHSREYNVEVLDGDIVRTHLSKGLGSVMRAAILILNASLLYVVC